MEPNKSLFIVLKSDSEKLKTILYNVQLMLSNRIYIDSKGDKKPLFDLAGADKKTEDRGDGTYVIKTNNGDQYAIKIIFQKITSTGKQSVVVDFFRDYGNSYKKIIIARDFNNKILDYMTKHRTQIFQEHSMLSNIIDYIDQPKFELLSPKEMKMFREEYNSTDYTTKKMRLIDPITRYYALQVGDIIRIIRPSPTCGEEIDYRVVMAD